MLPLLQSLEKNFLDAPHKNIRTPKMMNEKIAILMDELAVEENANSTSLPNVHIFKTSKHLEKEPLCYRQGIIIVGQGTKKIYLGGKTYEYNPDNYIVLTVPLPAECQVIADPLNPFLAMLIDIDLGVLNHIIAEMEHQSSCFCCQSKPKGLFVSKSTEAFHDATHRLLTALQNPVEAKVIGPGIVNELLYRVMCSENAHSLYSLATKNSNLARIDRALKQIHNNYQDAMDVDELASIVNMSPSSFHRTFKQVTSTSPIQYIKRIRLDKARGLLLEKGLRVNEAAREVGYESATQFSREFKRIFGISPVNVAAGVE